MGHKYENQGFFLAPLCRFQLVDEERTGFITVAMVKQKMEGDHSCLLSGLLLLLHVVRKRQQVASGLTLSADSLSTNAAQSPVCKSLGLPSAVRSEQVLAWQAQEKWLANAAL